MTIHHRVLYYECSDVKSEESWTDDDGNFHRDDGPAIITYYPSGEVWKKLWFFHNIHYNSSGPSTIEYHTNGNVCTEKWQNNHHRYSNMWRNKLYICGTLHREDGPAFIKYYKNRQIESTLWVMNGLIHRNGGPAYIKYAKDGKIIETNYFIKHKDVTDIVKNLFGCIPDKLSKEQNVLLALSI